MTTVEASRVHRHHLAWMAPQAPYAPVACVGLLDALHESDPRAAASWEGHGDGVAPPAMTIHTTLSVAGMAEAVMATPWPALDSLDWGVRPGQAIKPTLQKLVEGAGRDADAPAAWRRLARLDGSHDGRAGDERSRAAARLISALLTDGALDGAGLPGRSRLLRGVKADLSGVGKPPSTRVEELENELRHGPVWTSGSSGLGLGLVPEVQTFGGTTGPDPSSVGAYSKLLYRLCWLGIMAMPPYGVARGPQVVVGGPLFATPDTLSWPIWNAALGKVALITLFGLAAVHEPEPDRDLLRAHGITAAFRSRARALNTMISVFGGGDRVA
jgi:hypothetical protein